jgi:hypothetical protein
MTLVGLRVKMNTRILLEVQRRLVCMTDNLPPSSADVMESGSLNLPEPSGPHRPVTVCFTLL